jgi:hypothetical protein
LPSSQGNMVQLINSVGPSARYNTPIFSNGVVFYSVLIQLPSITSLLAAKTDTHGGGAFNIGFNNTQTTNQAAEPTGYYAPIYYGTSGSGYILGIGRGAGSTNRFWETNAPHSTSDTLFVVASYEFVPGVSNDIARLWINPDPSTFGAATYPQPDVIVDNTNNISSDADVNGGSIQSFLIANRNAGQPNLMYVDELRLGTNWAQVTAAYVAPAVIPTLTLAQQDASTVLLSWSTNSTSFVLQRAAQLLNASTPWADIGGTATISGSNYIQTDTINPTGPSFYRLRH